MRRLIGEYLNIQLSVCIDPSALARVRDCPHHARKKMRATFLHPSQKSRKILDQSVKLLVLGAAPPVSSSGFQGFYVLFVFSSQKYLFYGNLQVPPDLKDAILTLISALSHSRSHSDLKYDFIQRVFSTAFRAKWQL